MDVTFTRTGERRYGVMIERPDGPAMVMHPAAGFHAQVPHDLVHLAVELECGIALGVFGQVAAGGDAGTFHRADGTVDRKLRQRGKRLLKDHREDLVRSETLAQRVTVAWLKGARPARDPDVERACVRLDGLSARWTSLAVGESMTVAWALSPPRRGTPSPASRAHGRATPRR